MLNFLFLNDTSGDYHFGCTCTSEFIRSQLLQHGTCSSVGVMAIWQTPSPPVEDWDKEDAIASWMAAHTDIACEMNKCDAVVANGEGTILGWQNRQGTQTLLFLLYAAKIHLHKRVFLINHSSFPLNSPYTDSALSAEKAKACEIYRNVYSRLDFCAVRDMRSLAVLNSIGCRNVQLAADCLPLYVDANFHTTAQQGCGGYVLFSGGTMMNEKWPYFIKHVLPAFKTISSQVMFLFSETPSRVAEDDLQLMQKIEKHNRRHRLFGQRIGILRAKTANEWLQAIQQAAFFASGRFHHSLAALSVGTPFLVLGAHSPKNQLFNDLQPLAYLPWEQVPFVGLKATIEQLIQQKSLKGPYRELCRLAMHNFDFLKMSMVAPEIRTVG